MDKVDLIFIIIILVGFSIIIVSLTFLMKNSKKNAMDNGADESVQKIKDAIDKADLAIDDLNVISEELFEQFDGKQRELLFLYDMLEKKKALSNDKDLEIFDKNIKQEDKISHIDVSTDDSLENIPVQDMINPENIPMQDMINPENIPMQDMINPENIPVQDMINPENIPMQDMINSENIPVQDMINPENIPVQDMINPENIPVQNMINPENIPVQDMINPENIPMQNIQNQQTMVGYTQMQGVPIGSRNTQIQDAYINNGVDINSIDNKNIKIHPMLPIIKSLLEKGASVPDIARELNIGQGEIKLIMEFGKDFL